MRPHKRGKKQGNAKTNNQTVAAGANNILSTSSEKADCRYAPPPLWGGAQRQRSQKNR